MMPIRRGLTSLFRHIYKWRRAILVQAVLVATLVTATTLMPEQRVTLQQAVSLFRRLKQRGTTEAPYSNSGMAWRCSGNTNEELVRNLEKGKIFTSPRVREAMLAVDRGDFSSRSPYMDQPQGIGWNATISAPHMHAAALEYLKNHLVDGAYALDVGSGSGYLTVCMALMIGENGKVVGIEHIPELVELSKKNTQKHHADLLANGRILFVELIEQLAEGGRMLIPVGKESGNQVFLQVDKIDGQVTQKVIEHVIYVPLTSKSHQLGRYD